MAVTITLRPLSLSEAVRIHHELKTTPNIIGYTVGELLRQREVFVGEKDGQFGGVCFNTDLPFGWTEIALLYVLPEARSMGIGKALFNAAWNRAVERNRHLYILSRHPAVIVWMTERGMAVGPAGRRTPLAYQLFSLVYMAHPYRNWEAFRKLPQMLKAPRCRRAYLKSDK